MKISLRIILINFVVVVLILGSSFVAFYSIMYKTLSSQKSQDLLTSANNYVYAYRSKLLEAEDEFATLTSASKINFPVYRTLKTNTLDFILEADVANAERIKNYAYSTNVNRPKQRNSLEQFLEYNPYAVVLENKSSDRILYYGIVINEEMLNEFSEKIGAEIALILNDAPADISHNSINRKYIYVLSKASKMLGSKNNFDVYSQGADSDDILATFYKPEQDIKNINPTSFLVFTRMGEAAGLRETLRDLFLIIGIAGIALSLILTYLLTTKLRRQITDLSDATEKTKEGNFNYRINVRSKDEIGKLGRAFNIMLDELERNQKSKSDYSDFITLINKNPTLNEISEAALDKIVHTSGFTIGALYLVGDDKLSLLSANGYNGKKEIVKDEFDFYDKLIVDKETCEIDSDGELPVISSGMLSFKLRYLLIVPVIYNDKTIAVLELGSINKLSDEAKDYIDKIKSQLAIGLTNAKALMQLEEFVQELKKLNQDYQKQNEQIKNQNDKLLQLHNELKKQAAELEVQKQKAEESTNLKSQFLASMSHELRTPMNSILGLTELILEKAELNEKNRERLEVVLNSGRRLMTLINDILDLSKIEAGKMEIREEDISLEELIGEISGSVKPLVMNKNVRFEVVRNTNMGVIVNTDRGKIVQVLINLIGNAIKFTDKGLVTLKVNRSNDELIFDVIDTGIGISEENQKVIFEEFRQADGTTTRKYGGTGLGLTICKKIAKLLNGDLSLKSKVGKGSTFTFKVPLKLIGKTTPVDGEKINVDKLIKNRKNPILVIDDDQEVRYTIGQYLTSKGYDVIFAENGTKGVQMAVNHQPFAITLDVMMPHKDGWSVLKELKENEVTKDIPVIMISINGDKKVGYGLGAFEYFIKPISADKLLSAFSRLENLANKRIRKIVIVDDDDLEFEKFKREFKNEDITIEYIQDSEFAFNKISEVQPDLIILDLMMPKVDGITLSYKLKSNIKTKHIPILISTAKDLSEEERTKLSNIVEDIAVKSKGHPLDVLKVVRDRIRQQELSPDANIPGNGKSITNNNAELTKDKNINTGAPTRKGKMPEVLIVDDDPDTLFTIDEMVKDCNCKTILAKNGIECLRTIEKSIPDLILLDIMMPEMDGFQAIKTIRESPVWKDIQVFAVTAKAMSDEKDIIIKHGFNDYIPKPVNAAIISEKIEQLFSTIKV
ncbi:autoinducer 2 sensor kinase/phosphatase LuxQ [bacterium BMS3Abin03]|nr:autoinducer 2 sensor kinase/phosphatase LuxQ [bacterium BMS3Abin03]